jgi:hypothetical protein
MGVNIHIGFGVLLLLTVLGLIAIGILNPDLFDLIIQRIKDIIDALFPKIIQSLV